MTLPLPNLDDRTYADLVAEAISRIPIEYPEWTDHNPTDTGIILIELLAWLTEMTLYRVNQVPESNYASFVSLLKGEQWNLPINVSPEEKQKLLNAEIQTTLLQLRETYRAVTPVDYEKIILEDWNQLQSPNKPQIARVKCLPQRDLEKSDAQSFAKGHISLVVVCDQPNQNNYLDDYYLSLRKFLDDRKLLTTRLHVVAPVYINVIIETKLILEDGAKAEDLKEKAQDAVAKFFDHLRSGDYWQGKGWPFGRSIYLSDLYQLLDNLAGVDYVSSLILKTDVQTSVNEISLTDNQLVRFNFAASKFTIVVQVGSEQQNV
jgi:Baseplate J-like protein